MRWYLTYQTISEAADEGRLPFFAYTDYPITELGDAPLTLNAMRRVEVIDFDTNKYATVLVEGIETRIKLGYIFTIVEDTK